MPGRSTHSKTSATVRKGKLRLVSDSAYCPSSPRTRKRRPFCLRTAEDLDGVLGRVAVFDLKRQVGGRVHVHVDFLFAELGRDAPIVGQVETIVRLDAGVLILTLKVRLSGCHARDVEFLDDHPDERGESVDHALVNVGGSHEMSIPVKIDDPRPRLPAPDLQEAEIALPAEVEPSERLIRRARFGRGRSRFREE
jgi:hypothetical protein